MKNPLAALVRGLLRLTGRLPLRFHYAVGRIVSWLAGDVLRYRHDIVVHNLTRCFPEKDFYEIDALRKAFYRHFGEILAETIWFGACRHPERLRRAHIVEVENPEVLQGLFDTAPSVVVLLSHCGNWELLGGIGSYNYSDRPFPITERNTVMTYRELSSKMWDEIMRDNRTAPLEDPRQFEGYLESRDIIRYAFTHRGEKKIYHLNTDQRPYFASLANMEVDFLGQRISTMTGGAALARKFGMAVAYQSMHADGRGHYRIRYTPICEDASRMDVGEIMQGFYRLLEAEIREQPENWLWTHKRFVK